MTRPADWQQRATALDPERSFIVQAPAGSGKTELLTQRMLGLLARVENPEEVVAITFTRKAAAEMSHRLLERLRDADNDSSLSGLEDHERLSRQLALAVLENDRLCDWNLLTQPGRLRVRTIDSLCGELARQLPILSGLGGGQQVMERAEDLYREAAVRTMSAIEDSGDELQADVTRILNRYGNQYDRLVDLLTSMLGNRDQWLGFLLRSRLGDGFDRADMESALAFLVSKELEHAKTMLPPWLLAELPRFLRYSLEHQPEDEEEIRALLKDCGGSGENDALELRDDPSSLPHWISLTNRLLTKSGGWLKAAQGKHGFPAPSSAPAADKPLFKQWKDDFKALLERLAPDDDLSEQFKLVRSLPNPRYTDEAWESLQSLMRILVRATSEWKIVMAETGGADFTEIASRAIQALGGEDEPSDLALRLDYRIRHLLVDEFQDTSHNQVRLLERLTSGWSEGDGRTLFLVGDPMQSIYRFRKAEVSLFIRAFEGGLFDQLQLDPLRLTVNFRSAAPVVEWVNHSFPFVMPAEDDAITGAVQYSPSDTRPGVPESGSVHVRIMARKDDTTEAREIIDIINATGPGQKIAILVRARNHAAEILTLLDKLKQDDPRFRYRATQVTPLAETTLVRDLVSLTLALAQPADRLSWLAVLRAPFVGLGMADLDALAGGDDAVVIRESIATCLGGKSHHLSSDGVERLERAGAILLDASDRSGRQRIRDLVESAWIRLGGPACVQNRSELLDADTYFNLVESLDNEGLAVDGDTVAQRLRDLYAEPDADAGDSLQVMTIYSAKGLEFDTVILPGLNKGTRGDDGKLLHWFEVADADRFVMSPMRNVEERERQRHAGDLIQYISSIEQRRHAMENGRLLYVASTRAITRLYLFAAIEPDARGNICAAKQTLLGGLWPAIRDAQTPLISAEDCALAEQDEGSVPTEESCLPQLHRRLEPEWSLPDAPVPVPHEPVQTREPGDYIEFRWAGEDARLTGNLVHRLLQLIAEKGMDFWEQSGGMKAREAWCQKQLQAEGVRGRKAENIVSRTRQAISNCLSSEKGRWILGDHDEAACEFALTTTIDSQVTNLILDRTFVEKGVRWIIDYKTSVHSGGDLEGFLENESERYRSQIACYRRAMAAGETRPIRTALYFPLLDRLCELPE